MKGNEEASAKAFESLLQKLGLDCTWKYVYPANGFPDFEFTVKGYGATERWAVECTDLHQYIDHGGKEKSRLGVDRAIESLCERVSAKATPGSNRKYVITAMGPTFGIPASEVEKRAIEYIASGRTEHEALDIPEVNDADPDVREVKKRVAIEQANVHITTVLSPVPIVYAYGLDGRTMNADGEKMSADITATLQYALQRIVDDKLPKLAQCKSFTRRILLVWRGYWLAEPAQVKQILDAIEWDKSGVDAVLLALPDGSVHWVADPGKVFTE